jgi:hypothetical protein
MASKKDGTQKVEKKLVTADTEPKFPYTTKPSSLRRLLQDIPKKPRPPKFDKNQLRSWGFSDANDYSMLRVLKAIGLLNSNNEPTDLYSQYMHLESGATSLAEPIKRVYEPLFNASHAPYTESNDRLQNLFNIHSGGGERALEQQIQTFKALSENTSFEAVNPGSPASVTPAPGAVLTNVERTGTGSPSVHIDLHIHLPENKSRRDYEAMIEDIGRFIFGRTEGGQRDE